MKSHDSISWKLWASKCNCDFAMASENWLHVVSRWSMTC